MDTLEKREPDSVVVNTERKGSKKIFKPNVDIISDEKAITLIADIPGASEQSVDISLEKEVLTISGSVVSTEIEGHTRSYTEYDTGGYYRSFSITDDIDKERIMAVVKNGVLKVVLPKRESVIKKIEVKAA